MNIWDKIESCKPNLTPKELEIYEILQKDPYSFGSSSSMEIADRYGVAQSAISRFCQKVGFSGFADFRLSMAVGLSSGFYNLNDSSILGDQLQERLYTRAMCDVIRNVSDAIPDSLLDSLARRILESNSVYTSGYGASLCAAQSFAFLLTISSVPGHLLQASQESEALHMIKNTDTVFLFSISNPSHRDFLSLVADLPEEKRPFTILVTGSSKHPLRHKASQVVPLPLWNTITSGINPMILNFFVPMFAFCQLVIDRVNYIRANT